MHPGTLAKQSFAEYSLLHFTAGGTRCEISLTRTIIGVWLRNLDSVRFIPMMIARMIISLKEVASSRPLYLDPEMPSGSSTYFQDGHSPRVVGGIPLSVLKSERL